MRESERDRSSSDVSVPARAGQAGATQSSLEAEASRIRQSRRRKRLKHCWTPWHFKPELQGERDREVADGQMRPLTQAYRRVRGATRAGYPFGPQDFAARAVGKGLRRRGTAPTPAERPSGEGGPGPRPGAREGRLAAVARPGMGAHRGVARGAFRRSGPGD